MFDLDVGHDEKITDNMCKEACDCEINNNCSNQQLQNQTTVNQTHPPHPSHPTHPPHGGGHHGK